MNQDTKTLVLGVAASLVAAALFWLGTYLAELVPQENGLYYAIGLTKVGSLTTWNIEFINDSDTAIEQFQLQLPAHGLVQFSFEPTNPQKTNSSTEGWDGQLLRGQKLKVLFVFDSVDANFSQEQFQKLITAKSRAKDIEGRSVLSDANIQLGSPPKISRLLKQIGLFLIPMLAAGIMVLIIIYLPKRKP